MKVVRIVICGFLIFCLIFTLTIGKNKISEKKEIVKKEGYKCVLSLWQIDSFEGGTGSRKQFLLDVSRGFEKENEGVLVSIISHTKESAEENFKAGIFPDIISYGNGVKIENAVEINADKKFEGGTLNGKTYALPWCHGGYYLIHNGNENLSEIKSISNLLISQGEYTLPNLSLIFSGINVEEYKVLPPFNAYQEFVIGKTPYFLGTQRDICRLSRRGMEVKVLLLEDFCDLNQYVSVTTCDNLKKVYAEKFVNYLLNEKSQKKLKNISMASYYYQVDFDIEGLRDMQKIKTFNTVSPFILPEEIKNLQSIPLKEIINNEDIKIKIKNMLC